MRKAVLKKEQQTFLAKNANSNLYYGAVIDQKKGFIAKPNFYGEKYTIFCVNQLTQGNNWDHLNSNELSEVVQKAIEKGNEIYEFDSYQELFKWLSEE